MRRFAYMVLYLCILCVTGIYAQNGREQVSAQGEQLFQHTIEQGQTVYSIATMYGVSVDDIYRLNPGSKEQIKRRRRNVRLRRLRPPTWSGTKNFS